MRKSFLGSAFSSNDKNFGFFYCSPFSHSFVCIFILMSDSCTLFGYYVTLIKSQCMYNKNYESLKKLQEYAGNRGGWFVYVDFHSETLF